MVFGHVLSGQDVVKKIEQLPTDARSRPQVEVKIANCGELVLLKKGKGKGKHTIDHCDYLFTSSWVCAGQAEKTGFLDIGFPSLAKITAF